MLELPSKQVLKRSKVTGDLHQLHANYRQNSTALSSSSQESRAGMRIVDNYIVINATAVQDADELLQNLKSVGLKQGVSHGRVVSGLLPIDQIDNLADFDELLQARPSYARTRVGEVSNQADEAIRSDDVRSEFGLDGSGVKVGILSDSYNNLEGEAAGIASGDLPGLGNPLGNTTPVEVLRDLDEEEDGVSGTDEGRAMAELIHDIAPGAELLFRTAVLGQADFAAGIQELVAAGAKVIVDDIGFFAEPYFQDGVIAQAVDAAVAAGVSFFSAVGNDGGKASYESEFRASSSKIAGNEYLLHDFDPGATDDVLQEITIESGALVQFGLQWDQPFASAGGAASKNDLDIFLFDQNGSNVAAGIDSNVGGDALEGLSFVNNGPTATFNLAIGQLTSEGEPVPGRIKYIEFFGGATNTEFATNSPTAFGHPVAAGAAGVGAVDYRQTPEFGTDPAVVRPFSSSGGTPILFDASGNRLSSREFRAQPRFTAPDNTNTSFFGADSPEADIDGDGFPNFPGTSAAAPQAAAVAALILEANPNLTPAEVYAALEETALDQDDPSTPGFDVGDDRATGFGLIQADQALALLLNDTLRGGEQNDTLEGEKGNDVLLGRAGQDLLKGGKNNDVLKGGIGNDTLIGGDGNDVLAGGLDNDVLNGGLGNDTLRGWTGNDTLLGNKGRDQLRGLLGNDLIDGGDNNDTLQGGAGYDTLIGGDGNDVLAGGLDNDVLNGGIGNDTLRGWTGNDTLLGHAGNDLLVGGVGNDVLVGGAGNDTLIGSADQNVLVGGAGQDTFVLANDFGKTIIADFSRDSDLIDLNMETSTIGITDLDTNGDGLLSGGDALVTEVTSGLAINLESFNNGQLIFQNIANLITNDLLI